MCWECGGSQESGVKFKCPLNACVEWLTVGGGSGGGCFRVSVSLAQRSTARRSQLKVAELCLRACGNAVFSRSSSLCKHIKAKQRKWLGPCIAPDKRKFLLSRFASKGLRKKMSLFSPPLLNQPPNATLFILPLAPLLRLRHFCWRIDASSSAITSL